MRAELERALSSIRQGRFAEANEQLSTLGVALPGREHDALIAVTHGDRAAALEKWRAACAHAPTDFARTMSVTFERLGVLHRAAEQLAPNAREAGLGTLYAAVTRRRRALPRGAGDAAPQQPLARGELAGLLAEHGDHEAALALADDALTRVKLLIRLGERERARVMLLEAPASDATVALLVEAGALAEAKTRASPAWRARLACWRGVYAPDPSAPILVAGVCSLLRGDEDAAQTELTRAAERDPRAGEPWLWLGELARRRGEHAQAVELIDRGITLSHGYPLAGHVSRMIASMDAHGPDWNEESVDRELLALVAPITEAVGIGGDVSLPLTKRHLSAALDACCGNRSTRASYVAGGELLAYDPPRHSRFEARDLQELVRLRPVEHIIARLTALAAARDDEPTIHCHIGDVFLWVGDYSAARRAFERALRDSERVRWAYVGHCAASLGLGDLDEAFAWCDRGIRAMPPPGRTLYAYRGEAHRLRGEHDAAEADLRHMLSLTPQRISSWINLALVGGEASRATCLARVARRAPGLFGDARAERPAAGPTELLEHLLFMMRGNRSSSFVSYFTETGHMRFVPPAGRTI